MRVPIELNQLYLLVRHMRPHTERLFGSYYKITRGGRDDAELWLRENPTGEWQHAMNLMI
jgi:hypothetical protein